MKILLKRSVEDESGVHSPGSEMTVAQDDGLRLIRLQAAEEVVIPYVPPAVEPELKFEPEPTPVDVPTPFRRGRHPRR